MYAGHHESSSKNDLTHIKFLSESILLQNLTIKTNLLTKGQLISEWLFGVFNFPKIKRKNLMNFCPRILKVVKSDN